MTVWYLIVLTIMAGSAYVFGRNRAIAIRSASRLHSLPGYHGMHAALSVALPMLALLALWAFAAPRVIEATVLGELPAAAQPTDALSYTTRIREITSAASNAALADAAKPEIKLAAERLNSLQSTSNWLKLGLGASLGVLGLMVALRRTTADFRARSTVEKAVLAFLIACSIVAILTTVGIVSSLLFESLRFFAKYPWYDFLFGTQWSPQIAMRSDQVGQSGAFGFVPILGGTLLITLIAMLVAGPIGLLSAIYLAEYASPKFRSTIKPVLEILAGVPTVVFGFFAALTVAPTVRAVGSYFGLDVASESALAAGLVMGIMIIPFVSSLSDDVINAVPQHLRDGSYALGSTKAETIKLVVLPAAFGGIVSAFMLAISRAIGETMIVVMAAGLAGNLTFNPLDAVTTITVQIKTLLVGDQEFDSVKTLSAFALGLVLFFFTLILNTIALRLVRKYREQYD